MGRYVTFLRCEALPGGELLGVRPNGATDGCSVVDTGRRVRGERVDPRVVSPVALLIGRPGPVVGAAHGLAAGPLNKLAILLGPSRLCTSRGRLPENGNPSERVPSARLAGRLYKICLRDRYCLNFLAELQRQ